MKGYFKRTPVRQAQPRPVGWHATRDGERVHKDNFATPQEAQVIAGKVAGKQLTWQRSENPNIHGAYWYTSSDSGRSYSVSMEYITDKEAIPDAMYVSDDDDCLFYICPEANGWSIKYLRDWTTLPLSTSDIVMLTGMYVMDAHIAKHTIEHIEIAKATSREKALQYGRYIWAAYLAKNTSPPPTSKWRAKLREVALKWL